MPATAAFAGAIIFEKLHELTTFRAFYLKNGPRLPVFGILSGTSHKMGLLKLFNPVINTSSPS
jgi:hypothetical protein